MGGSKKGEHRGNARKKPWQTKPWIRKGRRVAHSLSLQQQREKEARRTHETPGEIMDRQVRTPNSHKRMETLSVERRIMVSRVILGRSGAVEDITPKEAMLMGMRHGLQAVRDITDMIEELAKLEPTEAVTTQIAQLEMELERQYGVAGEFAFKVAGYIHPKLMASHNTVDVGANQQTVLQMLMDEINERERNAPIPIEHKPKLIGSS